MIEDDYTYIVVGIAGRKDGNDAMICGHVE
jgi:hypothetical protein